jgi:NitT/TauT family transport system permease protein
MREETTAFVELLPGEARPGLAARALRGGIALLRDNAVVFLVYGFLLAIWELSGPLFSVPAYLLPAPSAIAHRLLREPSVIASHALVTLQEVVLGFSAAWLFAIPIGVLIVCSRAVERAVYPLLVSFQAIPKVALAPILVIWFGFGLTSKVSLAFVTAMFPIVVNTVVGMAQTPPEMIHLMRSLGASNLQIFVKVRLVAAAPFIFSGFKIGITLAMVGAVVGEFIASNAGLGYCLLIANAAFDTPLLFGAVILLALLSVLLFYAVELVEAVVLPPPLRKRSRLETGRATA